MSKNVDDSNETMNASAEFALATFQAELTRVEPIHARHIQNWFTAVASLEHLETLASDDVTDKAVEIVSATLGMEGECLSMIKAGLNQATGISTYSIDDSGKFVPGTVCMVKPHKNTEHDVGLMVVIVGSVPKGTSIPVQYDESGMSGTIVTSADVTYEVDKQTRTATSMMTGEKIKTYFIADIYLVEKQKEIWAHGHI